MISDYVEDLIADSGYGLMATTEGDQPKVRPVAPLLTEDNKLLIALFPGRKSILQIKENPLVEVCFVDRRMCICRVSGKAEMTDNQENKNLLWERVAQLKQFFEGPEDPLFNLMEITITQIETMAPGDKEPTSVPIS